MIGPLTGDVVEVLVAPVWAVATVFIALGVAWLLRKPLRAMGRDLGVSKVSVLGIDIEWIAEQTQSAYQDKRLQVPSQGKLRSFALLSARLAPLLEHRRVLWVDDNPSNNQVEAKLLRNLGVDVENALSTDEATGRLRRDPARFDVVISDWV
ncbi:MAG TPA: hypothetical protein VI111_09190, partial [Thermoleophilaceae bacterium]